MRRATLLIVSISILIVLTVPPALAQDGQSESYPFRLLEHSSFQVGCVEPCLCPTFSRAVRGEFKLVPRGYDGRYYTYAVLDVQWALPGIDGTVISVNGSGRYQIGGAVAPTQRMQLDLSVGGQPVQRFDSGFVHGGWSFPKIEIAIAVNEFFCYDSVFVVIAESLVPLAVGGEPDARVPLQAQPNPFHGRTEVAFALPATETVSLSVVDIAGRDVSTLIDAESFSAGRHTATWNGRAADGRSSPPGIYFVRLDVGGRSTVRRLVKLE